MAFQRGPNIVTNGLIFAVDAGNVKSYVSGTTTWRDLSGNSNTGTINNNPTYSIDTVPHFDFTTNIAGGTFSGINQNIVFQSSTIPTSGSFTIETWMNRDSSSIALGDRESIFSNTGGSDGFRVQITQASPAQGTLHYLIGGSGGGYSEGPVGSGYNIADGKWHQVVAVFDRAAQLGSYAVSAYVDGIFKASTPISTGNQAFTAAQPGISVGCCNKYRGKISKIIAYNRAMTASEILQNYNASKSRYNPE